jgi:hypothetical protein
MPTRAGWYTFTVPTKKDNENERFARINALMEEYRVNHENLEHYIRNIHPGMNEVRDRARDDADGSKKRMNTRRPLKKSKG